MLNDQKTELLKDYLQTQVTLGYNKKESKKFIIPEGRIVVDHSEEKENILEI